MPLSFTRRKQGDSCSLLGDTRGAAMLEGVIVLPVFAILFAALLHVHAVFSTKLERSELARSCAWEYSAGGCVKRPPGCPIRSIAEHELESIDEDMTTGANASVGEGLEKADSVLRALAGLREGIVAHPESEIEVPSLLGGGRASVGASYAVMCNERHFTVLELAEEAYCAIGEDSLPGCEK